MKRSDSIVAVGLLSQRDLDILGGGFTRAYPVEDVACFDELLKAIDAADLSVRTHAEKLDQIRGR